MAAADAAAMMWVQLLFNSAGESVIPGVKVASGQKVASVKMHWRKVDVTD